MEVKQTLIILEGLPASGKSRFARAWIEGRTEESPAGVPIYCPPERPRERINYDDLRLELYGPDWKWNRKDEDNMKAEARKRFHAYVQSGADVIIDNTNLTPKARQMWSGLGNVYGMRIENIHIDTPLSTCLAQDRLRTGRDYVGRAVIERMALFNGHIDFTDLALYPRDFIIVDMDGTLADCEHRRKAAFGGPTVHKWTYAYSGDKIGEKCPLDGVVNDRECPECGGKAKKNWPLFYKNVEADPVIQPIASLIAGLVHQDCCAVGPESCEKGCNHPPNYDVIIVSGRPTDEAGKATEEWLVNNAPFGIRHLFMRNALDYRPDFIVKEEILGHLPKERIKWVFDDRQQVVDMWRRNGLTCLQVAEGLF